MGCRASDFPLFAGQTGIEVWGGPTNGKPTNWWASRWSAHPTPRCRFVRRTAGNPMLDSPLPWPTIHVAAAALRRKETTPAELVRLCLAKIDRREDAVKAWVFVDR